MDSKGMFDRALEKAQPAPKKKRRKKKTAKRIIITIIVLAILGGIAFGMYSLFKEPEEEAKEIMPGFVYRGSIQSMVNGSGSAKPTDSTTITLTASGTVQEVFVEEGALVNEGDPLYIIDSSEVREKVEKAQEYVDDQQKILDDLQDKHNSLTTVAPYSGKIMEVRVSDDLELGNLAPAGAIALLVDDSVMDITMYFSYAYEDSIYVGQSARVTVPSSMTQVTGSVKEISYVEFISPEGGRFFEVTLSVPNPGSLTEGVAASAVLTAADGSDIYPYESGTFKFSRRTEVKNEVAGDLLYMNLKKYMRVSAGDVLMQVAADDLETQIANQKVTLQSAVDNLTAAQDSLSAFEAYAPMSGTVLSCSLQPGQEVKSGLAAISIADTSVMIIEAQVDEMNISYVKPGMMVDVYQYGRNGQEYFMGTVSSVSLQGQFQNGMSTFPITISVQNPFGTLMSGMYVDYSMLASQSDNCLLVPVQAVKYTEQGTCLFVKAFGPPAGALDAETLGIEVPEGYYAVPVTVGLSDNTSAEITEGVEEGTEVFVQYLTNSGDSFSNMGFGMGW